MKAHKTVFGKFKVIIGGIFRGVSIIYIAFFSFMTYVTILHAGLHVCPYRFLRFEKSQIIPVIYGLPTQEAIEEAKEGKVRLGGCIVVCWEESGVCPYCKWPVQFITPWNSAIFHRNLKQ